MLVNCLLVACSRARLTRLREHARQNSVLKLELGYTEITTIFFVAIADPTSPWDCMASTSPHSWEPTTHTPLIRDRRARHLPLIGPTILRTQNSTHLPRNSHITNSHWRCYSHSKYEEKRKVARSYHINIVVVTVTLVVVILWLCTQWNAFIV
jgi:hypothetical protein